LRDPIIRLASWPKKKKQRGKAGDDKPATPEQAAELAATVYEYFMSQSSGPVSKNPSSLALPMR
jgi:hypothetical protein